MNSHILDIKVKKFFFIIFELFDIIFILEIFSLVSHHITLRCGGSGGRLRALGLGRLRGRCIDWAAAPERTNDRVRPPRSATVAQPRMSAPLLLLAACCWAAAAALPSPHASPSAVSRFAQMNQNNPSPWLPSQQLI